MFNHDEFFNVFSIICIASSTSFAVTISGGARRITLSSAGTHNKPFSVNNWFTAIFVISIYLIWGILYNKKLYDQYANQLITSYLATQQTLPMYVFVEDDPKSYPQINNVYYHNLLHHIFYSCRVQKFYYS